MANRDGGPAFSGVSRWMQEFADDGKCIGSYPSGGHPGMSLRDWFAGQALVALPNIGCGADLEQDEYAIAAYQIADAMLAARTRKEASE